MLYVGEEEEVSEEKLTGRNSVSLYTAMVINGTKLLKLSVNNRWVTHMKT